MSLMEILSYFKMHFNGKNSKRIRRERWEKCVAEIYNANSTRQYEGHLRLLSREGLLSLMSRILIFFLHIKV